MTATAIGLTHISLQVTDIERSVAFYERWANMEIVDRVQDPKTGNRAVRLSDHQSPVELALVQSSQPVGTRLGGLGHLGVACADRDTVTQRAKEAEQDGCLRKGPIDSGFPLGYWAFLVDPDNNQLELSYGQNDKNA
jgi:catechol 2,3-dioxygenase-like lactoylglutathione lyase family enzyme